MRRGVVILVVTVIAYGCGGDYGGAGNPAGPTGSDGPPASDPPITINIVGDRGGQSFSPNPATIPDGRMVVWRNTDAIVHRVVLNDRSVDTGDIGPGASTAPRAIGGGPKGYHCSLHTSMVGSLNGAASGPAPGPEPGEEGY